MRLARLFGAAPPAGRKQDKPRSIGALLERAEDSGTHSILDIMEIAPRRREGAATRLSEKTIERVFGTARPSRDQVEAHWSDVAESLRREHACFLVVFRDDQPDEYPFIGVSGDSGERRVVSKRVIRVCVAGRKRTGEGSSPSRTDD